MRAVCLTHVPFEGPGALASHLHAQGIAIERYLVPIDGLPKDPGDLLLVMGGPMSVNDSDPWITDETAFIRATIQAGGSVLGICLGSQLMAKALGATIRRGTAPELGMTPIRLTAEGRTDPVFGRFPDCFEVFQWHGEVFDLPQHAIPLASSAIAPVQAFRYGDRAYGLLFHLEMDHAGMVALCRACAPDLQRSGRTATGLVEDALPHLPASHQRAADLLAYLLAPLR